MSPELKAYYQSIQTWIDEGAPWFKPYDRHDGLCDNLYLYAAIAKIDEEIENNIAIEMEKQFLDAGLSSAYPFNNSDPASYNDTAHAGLLYQNQKRLQWIKDHAT